MIKQGTKEWFNQRVGRITGSRVGAILGTNPWSSPDDVMRAMVREYHGAESEFSGNIATEHGNRYENMAKEDLELLIGESITDEPFYKYEDWLGASPDGRTESGQNVEIKCPFSLRKETTNKKFKSILDQKHYYAQIQFEMFCGETIETLFYQWNPLGIDTIERIPIDHAFIKESLPILKRFHEKYLNELNNSKHLEPIIQHIDCEISGALIDDYFSNKDKIKDMDLINNDIISMLSGICGETDSIVHGHKFSRVQKDGAISYAKAIKDIAPDADLEKYRGKPSSYWILK